MTTHVYVNRRSCAEETHPAHTQTNAPPLFPLNNTDKFEPHRKAITDAKKAANKQRDLQILLAKQEQERARERETRRKDKVQKKQSKLEALSVDVLASLEEKDRRKEEEEALAAVKEKKKTKFVSLGVGPTHVKKNGFIIQKLEAQVTYMSACEDTDVRCRKGSSVALLI